MIEPTFEDVGRRVAYWPTRRTWGSALSVGPPEEGTITSMNEKHVFVRYGADVNSKATRREDLEWVDPMEREEVMFDRGKLAEALATAAMHGISSYFMQEGGFAKFGPNARVEIDPSGTAIVVSLPDADMEFTVTVKGEKE